MRCTHYPSTRSACLRPVVTGEGTEPRCEKHAKPEVDIVAGTSLDVRVVVDDWRAGDYRIA